LYRLDEDLLPRTSRPNDGQKTTSVSPPGFLLTKAFFGPGSAELSKADSQKIRESARIFIEKYSGRKIAVESYVDPSGSVQQKEALAAGRAETVVRILNQAGVDRSRIEIIAHPSGPTSASTLSWAQMRRVEVSVKPQQ
jgi:outer membrane protein OmpA-like peptidoglycan-associated protein